MGNGIELFRMTVYLFFPVGVFYFFNRPGFYDKYVKDTRDKLKSPSSSEKMPKTLKEVDELAEKMRAKRKREETDQLSEGKYTN